MAVTRVIQNIDNLLDKSSVRYNVNGSESARILLDVSAIEGYMDIGLYATSGTEAATTDPRPTAWLDGVKLNGNARISTVGIHEVWIDLRNIRSIYIYISRSALTKYTGTFSFATFADPINLAEIEKNVDTSVKNGGWSMDFYPEGETAQLDFSVKMLSEVSNDARKYLRMRGVKKGDDTNTWVNILYLDKTTGGFAVDGWMDLKKLPNIEGFANVGAFKQVRLSADLATQDKIKIEPVFHEGLIDGREMYFNYGLGEYGFAVNVGQFMCGYRSFLVDLKGTHIKGGTGKLTAVYKRDNVDQELEVRGTDFKRLNLPYRGRSERVVELKGEIMNGGFSVVLDETSKASDTVYLLAESTPGTTRNVQVKVTAYTDAPQLEAKLDVFSEKKGYTIYESPIKALKDAYNGDFLEYSANELTFYHMGMYGIKYKIPFDNTSVPSILAGETIQMAFLQPYGSRTGSIGHEYAENRIIIFTNKCRILHNFPNKLVDGKAKSDATDLSKFDESPLVNEYKKWLPSNSKNNVSNIRKYFPVLKDYNYTQFDGRVAGSPGFIDHFGNGGLQQPEDNSKILMDFQTPTAQLNKLTIGNIARDGKMTMFGNYNTGIGSEPFVMGTSDGGRTWKVVQTFALIDMYNNNIRGGDIDLSPIESVTPYIASSLQFFRKEYNHPTKENKEPNVPFIIPDAIGDVKRFYVENGTTMIELATPVHFGGVTPIVFFKKNPAAANIGDWQYICNEGMTADGSDNNGVFFRLVRVNNTTYKLYADYGDPYQSDWVCRHVHAVTKSPNGFVVSTGETYTGKDKIMSGGLLYLILQNLQDGGGVVSIDTVKEENIYRLTSTGDGVNRACGAYIFNDGQNDPTMLFVGDEGANPKYDWQIEGRTKGIPIAPYGIYKIKLKDIDDVSKAVCVCEHNRTIVSLVQHMGHFAADGHVSELMLSNDGENWEVEALIDNFIIRGFDNLGRMYTADKMIVFK